MTERTEDRLSKKINLWKQSITKAITNPRQQEQKTIGCHLHYLHKQFPKHQVRVTGVKSELPT
jgi:hypothetical protein